MKNQLKSLILLAVGILAIASCQEKNDGFPERIQREIDAVTALMADELITVDIQGGDETRAFGFRTFSDNEEEFSARLLGNQTEKNEHEKKVERSRLINCLMQLELSDAQIREIRGLVMGMAECRLDAFQSLREEMVIIILAMENRRLELLEKLLKQEINRDQFRQGLIAIRESFKNQIEEIRKKHIEMVKPCIRETVTQLREVLGEEKWNQLYSCMKD